MTNLLQKGKGQVMMPFRINVINQHADGEYCYKVRDLIENFYAKFKWNTGITVRYVKLA